MIVLNILGTILKVIGIILLCILFLLLVIFLVLLFVPLRYRAQFFREGKKMAAHAQISYLFHLIYLPVDFEDGKLKISFRILGFTLFSNTGGAKEKKKRASKKGKKKEVLNEEEKAEEITKQNGLKLEEESEEKPKENLEENSESVTVKREEQAKEEETIKVSSEERENIPVKKKRGLCSIAKKIARKGRILYKKFVVIYQKIRRSIKNILEKILSGKEKIADLREKIQLIFTFLRDEENKNGIKYAGKSILQLLKHILPYKIEGDLVFATGNAYSMGRALSVLGILYPLYGKRLKLTADFEADAFLLEGRAELAGRIRFGTILWIAFKLWRKGRILALISSAKELKHKLTTSAL